MGTIANRAFLARNQEGSRSWGANRRSMLAFAIGCCAPIQIKTIGVIYIGELLLLPIALWVLLTRLNKASFWSPMAVRMLTLATIALGSYILTDVLRDTPREDYLRGWSRLSFIITNFIALYYLTRNNRTGIPAFFLGSKIVTLIIAIYDYGVNNGDFFITYWKYGFGIPLAIICLCLPALLGKFNAIGVASMLGVMGILNVFLDYRSLALTCLAVAAVILATRRVRRGKIKLDRRMLVITAVAAALVLGRFYFTSQTDFADRRTSSNAWRLGTTVALVKGIMRSPFIGNGSWSTDTEMEGWRDEAIQAAVGRRLAIGKADRFTGHSQFLQAWYEGGIATQPFFLYYGFQLAVMFRFLLKRRMDGLSALFLFLTIDFAWGFFFDPLNGSIRFSIAAALSLICYSQAEKFAIVRESKYRAKILAAGLRRAPLQDAYRRT